MSNWIRKSFSEAPIEIIDGDRGVNYPAKSDFSNVGYCLFLSTNNVTTLGFNFNSVDFISKEKDEVLRKGKLKRGDIVLTTRGTVGNVAYFSDNIPFDNIRINSGMVILRSNFKEIHPYYLYLFLRSNLFKRQVISQTSGSAQPQLPISSLNNIYIPWKEIATQQKIASVLSALDSKIELNNRINAELEAMAKTLYDYWFVQFDFPNAKGKPYKSSGGKMVWSEELKREVPAGWEVKRLKEFAQTGSGATPLSTKREFYENGNIPWINSGEVNSSFIIEAKKFITESGLNNSSAKLYPKGTILMAMYGATAGQVSLMNIEACTNQAICSIIPNDNKLIPYIKFALHQMYEYLINLSSGSARDNLSQDKIRDLFFAIPNDEIIFEFYQISNSCFDKILTNLNENKKLAELRDWLLPMLMNGQVKVG